jgi:hypothetical protein
MIDWTELASRSISYSVVTHTFFDTEREKKVALSGCRRVLAVPLLKDLAKKMTALPYGFSSECIDKAIEGVEKKDKFTLFAGARLNLDKRWREIIDAYNRFYAFGRDVGIQVCCPANAKNPIRELVKTNEAIQIKAECPQAEFLREAASSHVVLNTSKVEGFSVGICYDSETEVMTERGWRHFPDARGLRLLTMDPKTRVAEYTRSRRWIEYEYEGDVYENDEKMVNFVVTPGHSMLVASLGSAKARRKYGLRSIEDALKLQRFTVTTELLWRGKNTESFELPAYKKQWEASWSRRAKRSFAAPAKKVSMTQWLRLLGWFVSEGYCGQRSVEISQRPGANLKRIEGCIRGCGFKFSSLLKKDGMVHVRISSVQLANWLRENCYVGEPRRSSTKRVPDFVFELSKELIQEFLEAEWRGDGWRHDKSRTFGTVSKQLADDLQRLILLTGKGATIGRYKCNGKLPKGRMRSKQGAEFIFYVNERRTSASVVWSERVRRRKYKGKVFCASVPPNETLLVRRKGKPMWCGNCQQLYVGLIMILPDADWVKELLQDRYSDYPFLYEDGKMDQADALLRHIYEHYDECKKQVGWVPGWLKEKYDSKTVCVPQMYENLKRLSKEDVKVDRFWSPQTVRIFKKVVKTMPARFKFLDYIDKLVETSQMLPPRLNEPRLGRPSRWAVWAWLKGHGYRDTCTTEMPVFERIE